MSLDVQRLGPHDVSGNGPQHRVANREPNGFTDERGDRVPRRERLLDEQSPRPAGRTNNEQTHDAVRVGAGRRRALTIHL